MRYVIGDIHGCYQELEMLCTQILKQDSQAQLYSLGDIMNKGPDSYQCIQLLEKYGVKCIAGNHDLAWLKWSKSDPSVLKPKHLKALERYTAAQIEHIQAFISTLPLWRDLGDFLLVHAGLDPRTQVLEEMSPLLLTTIRYWDSLGIDLNNPADPHWYECVQWTKPVIFGHWALHGLMLGQDYICLDSGCVYGKELSALCLESGELLQVQALRAYVPLD